MSDSEIKRISDQFWKDVRCTEAIHSDTVVIWYKDKFYSYAANMTSAKQKAEALLKTVLDESVSHETK